MRQIWMRSVRPLVTFSTLLLLNVVAAPTERGNEDDFMPGEVVVKLARAADLPGMAADFGLDPMPLDQFGSRAIYRLLIIDGAPPPAKAAELTSDRRGRVLYAEPNYVAQTPEDRARVVWSSGGSETEYRAQWGPTVIKLPEAHITTSGADIKIAVLDTGVDHTHPALAGRLVAGYDFVDQDSDPSEAGEYGRNAAYGHGTHVAGVVALVAPGAWIMPVRVLDPDGAGNIWVLAEALAYAVDPDGDPATDDGADVINLSLSTKRRTDLLSEIVNRVCDNGGGGQGEGNPGPWRRRGVVVVAAAGNSGTNIREYPAAERVNGLLAVAASTTTDTLADFSARGSWVSVVAPGQSILSTVPGGGYGTWSGTSMATPFVAGQVALLRAVYPSLRPAELAQRIVESAARIDGPVPRRIDAAAALRANRGGSGQN